MRQPLVQKFVCKFPHFIARSNQMVFGVMANHILAIIFATTDRKSGHSFLPSFTKIYGLTILERTFRALEKAGVAKIIVREGEAASEIEKLVEKKSPWEVTFDFDSSNNFQKVSGILLVAEPLVVDAALFQLILAAENLPNEFLITSDGKVAFLDSEVLGQLKMNSGADFPSFEETIRLAERSGFQKKKVGTTEFLCSPVKNKEDLQKVKKALIQSLIKPTDGWVSRHLNRPISTSISRLLAPTSITPNQFTLFTGLIGLATGFFMAMGGYFHYLIGATLFQATSVLDGVDGELARLKFKSSPYGQWLDTVVDNLSYLAGLAGIIIGVYRTGAPEFVIVASKVALVFTALDFLSMYLYLLRFNRGGTLLNIKYNFQDGDSRFDKFMRCVALLGRRDLFALIFFGLGIIGQMPFALVYVCVMTIMGFVFLFPAHFQAAKEKKMEKNFPTTK